MRVDHMAIHLMGIDLVTPSLLEVVGHVTNAL